MEIRGDMFTVTAASTGSWFLSPHWYQLARLRISSAPVKLPLSLSFNQNLLVTWETARPLRVISHAQGHCEGCSDTAAPGICSFWQDAPANLPLCAHTTAPRAGDRCPCDIVTRPAVAVPMLICLRYVGPPFSRVIFPPRAGRLAGSVPIHATWSWKKSLGQASESTEISPSDLQLDKSLWCC